MKRSLVIALQLVIIATASYSQLPYRPMLEEGKVWVYENHHFEMLEIRDNWEIIYDEQISFPRYTIMGDTLINGVRYNKLMCCIEDENPVYNKALREEGTAVYCIDNGKTEEYVLQDFDVNKYPDIFRWQTDSIDYILVDGIYYLRHHYYNQNGQALAVEGIGLEHHGIVYGMHVHLLSGKKDYMFFSWCELNGKTIFTNDDFYTPAVELSAINTAQTKKNAASPYYDLQGRRLQNKPGKGVYVSKGRKMVQ